MTALPALYRARIDAAMAALMAWYDPGRGLWRTSGWWNAANALTVVVDYGRRTGATTYQSVLATTFEQNRNWGLGRAGQWLYRGHFRNRYYDDEGWWALAWLSAYDLTTEHRYLSMAKTLFADMTVGWDATCRGGLLWKKWDGPGWVPYKNAITTELFLTLAARLYRRTGTPLYRAWAERAWAWFAASGLRNAHNLINDGLDGACRNNGGVTWTYNQGVILGGLVALAQITGESSYLAHAHAIAEAALQALTDANGILTEFGEADIRADDPDRAQFKGIFVRHLAVLEAADPQPAYRAFLVHNAETLWRQDRTDLNQFGMRWAGPVDRTDATRQTAALDLLLAALPFVPTEPATKVAT